MRGGRIAAAGLLLFCGCAAQAADDAAGARILDAFARCRAIAAADARLDCFDKASAALETAVRTNEVKIVDKQEIRKAKRSLFGFSIPRIGLFGGDGPGEDRKDEPEFTELSSTITSVRSRDNGRFELRIAEGEAVWATTDPLAFPPRSGAKIRIRKGALGNYFLAIDGSRSVRGIRLR